MPSSPELARLAAEWRERGRPTAFAALADGLRKAGELSAAWDVVLDGVTRHPGFAPGRLAQAAILEARGAAGAAEAVYREVLAVEAGHPIARERLARLAGGAPGAEVGTSPPDATPSIPPDASHDEPPDLPAGGEEPAGLLLSESLAALYYRQGHLEQALAAYHALAERHPDQPSLAARREAIASELAARSPLPHAAEAAGGTSVRDWLAGIAAARPAAPTAPAAYDAFYQAPPAPAEATQDFASFQRWLEELGR